MACGPKEKAAAGSASPDDVLKYLPVDAQGVIFIDVHRAMATEVANQLIQEDESYAKYQEIVQKTGIDPQQDIFYVAVGILAGSFEGKEDVAAIVNLKYDKEKILTLIQEEGGKEPVTEDYSGITLYSMPDEDEDAFAFLDASNAVVGNPQSVKGCIDVMQGSKDNVFKNQALAEVLGRTEKDSLFWGAILIPQKDIAQATEGNPQLKPLQNMKALILNFDHKNAMVTARIKAESDNAEANQQISEMLTGFKAMGAMMIPEDKPELGDLLSSIAVSHAADHVMIEASIPDDLIQKLKSALPGQEEEEK
jgi:hypothetical protein